MSGLFENLYLTPFLNAVNSSKGPLELEVRFRGDDEYNPVSFKEFFRVQEYLTGKYGNPIISSTQDLIKSKMRQTVVNEDDSSFTLINITKRTLFSRDDENKFIGIKISLASEQQIMTDVKIEDPEVIRDKFRQSWTNETLGIRFDITKVTETLKGKEPKEKYEVEIEMINEILEKRSYPMTQNEMINFKKAFLTLGDQAANLRKIMEDTDLPYTYNNRDVLINFIHTSINAKQYSRFEPNKGQLIEFFVRARNIKLQDMVYGGLLKDPKKNISYSVTCKAEGLHKFLVIHRSGLWLVFGNEFCKVARFEDLPLSWQQCENTILDGEDIPVEHRYVYKNAKHFFLPFDALLFKGKDVTKQDLNQRLEYAKIIRNLGVLQIKGEINLIMEEKPFYYFDTAKEFYSSIRKIFNFIDNNAKYKTDGLMFTPVNTEYNPKSDMKFKKEERILTIAPDICKWKPFEELTVDLRYFATVRRYLTTSRGTEFKGSRKFPFNPETQVDWLSPIFKDIPNGTIIEFEPRYNSDGDIILSPRRTRFDKATPNSPDTASDVWDDINKPISKETLLGTSMDLQRQYHNNIKRLILKNVPLNAHLIDIGSGAGGDLSKWGKFSKVLAIEPNGELLDEFNRRLENIKDVDKVHTLKSGGEETGKIAKAVTEVFGDEIGSQPMYVSMMLSLSFFWGEERMLRQLCETIITIRNLVKERNQLQEVRFIFMTIEGSRTMQLFKKYNNNINFPGVKMIYNPEDEKVFINFPGSKTIIGTQEEYIVKLSELPLLLNAKVENEREATGTKDLLNSYEKEFTSMYVYGTYLLN